MPYKPRVTVIIDTTEWALGFHCQDLKRELPQYDIRHAFGARAKYLPPGVADVVLSLGIWWEPECYPPELCAINVRGRRQLNHKLLRHNPDKIRAHLDAHYGGGVYGVNRRIADELRLSRADARYLPSSIDTHRFRPQARSPHDTLVVGWAGKRQGCKRVEVIEAAVASMPNVELRIAAKNTDSCVPWEHVQDWYADLDAYVCASTYEGSNRSMLEAMACGVPAVTTWCGEAEELIDPGVNGYRFDGTAAGLRETLGRVFASEAHRAALGAAARNTIEGGWSWDVNRGQYADVFERLLQA